MRTQRISFLLKKRFTTPNWVKHKEPREVHMFVDLFLQELEVISNEVKQILPQGIRKHRRTDSNGSSASSSSKRYIIKIKAGVYRENVDVPMKKTNIMFLGDGRTNTIITASRNVVDGSTTFNSATVVL